MSPRQLSELAFSLYERGCITHDELVYVVGQCINAAGVIRHHGTPHSQKEAVR